MSNIALTRHCEVMLAIQQALLGEVTADLRAVTVNYTVTSIHFEAYFHGEINEKEREAMSLVETEIMAVFPSTHTMTHEVTRLDEPARIPKNRIWVYFRKEYSFRQYKMNTHRIRQSGHVQLANGVENIEPKP